MNRKKKIKNVETIFKNVETILFICLVVTFGAIFATWIISEYNENHVYPLNLTLVNKSDEVEGNQNKTVILNASAEIQYRNSNATFPLCNQSFINFVYHPNTEHNEWICLKKCNGNFDWHEIGTGAWLNPALCKDNVIPTYVEIITSKIDTSKNIAVYRWMSVRQSKMQN